MNTLLNVIRVYFIGFFHVKEDKTAPDYIDPYYGVSNYELDLYEELFGDTTDDLDDLWFSMTEDECLADYGIEAIEKDEPEYSPSLSVEQVVELMTVSHKEIV